MSLSVDGVWKAGVWAATVWGNCVWFEPGCASAPTEAPGGGTSSRRKKRRVIRLSDLDERERQEALASIPVRPFDDIERAAAELAEADEEEQEEDELILMAITRLYH